MFGRILVAIDRSEHAKRVVATSIQLARLSGARIYLVHVMDGFSSVYIPTELILPVPGIESDQFEEVKLSLKKNSISFMEGFGSEIEEGGVPVEMHLREGNAAEEICAEAEARDVDLIIVGRRGVSSVADLFLGGVSQKVITHLHRSVLVVQ